MQNTYQEKSSDPIDKDFLFGKKLEGGIKLSTVTDFKPAGDQPEAIKKLISGIIVRKMIRCFWELPVLERLFLWPKSLKL